MANFQKEDDKMMKHPMAIAFAVGLAGAGLFVAVGAPMPWLLGPLFAVLLMQLFTPVLLKWHPRFRNSGLVVAGTLNCLIAALFNFPLSPSNNSSPVSTENKIQQGTAFY